MVEDIRPPEEVRCVDARPGEAPRGGQGREGEEERGERMHDLNVTDGTPRQCIPTVFFSFPPSLLPSLPVYQTSSPPVPAEEVWAWLPTVPRRTARAWESGCPSFPPLSRPPSLPGLPLPLEAKRGRRCWRRASLALGGRKKGRREGGRERGREGGIGLVKGLRRKG